MLKRYYKCFCRRFSSYWTYRFLLASPPLSLSSFLFFFLGGGARAPGAPPAWIRAWIWYDCWKKCEKLLLIVYKTINRFYKDIVWCQPLGCFKALGSWTMTLCLTVAISEKKSYLPRSALKITVNIQKECSRGNFTTSSLHMHQNNVTIQKLCSLGWRKLTKFDSHI